MVCEERESLTGEITYEVDWESKLSLHNWMTDLSLECESKFNIALIGGISFLSFSVGSIVLTRAIDKRGRRQILLFASVFTILGVVVLLFFANSLFFIYAVIFMMGLLYNTRSSSAYIFGTEYMQKS